MHLFRYKTVPLSMKAILCSNLEKSVCRILRKFGNFRVTFKQFLDATCYEFFFKLTLDY